MQASKYNDQKYDIQVVSGESLDGFSADGVISTGCLVFVYDAGTKTLSTIYKDGLRTALTSPISRSQFATDGRIKFFGPNTSYDIFIAHSDGHVTRKAGVTPSTHTVRLETGGVEKCVVFPMIYNAGGTVTDTGIDLPIDVIVTDVRVQVTVADATETVDVGLLASETNGDEDGFVAAVSVASTGFPSMRTITVGSNENYLSAFKVGALLGSLKVGVDTAGREGQALITGHIVTGANAKSLTYTPSSSDTFEGYGYVHFRHLR